MAQGDDALSEKAAAVLSQFPGPATIHLSRRKFLALFVLPIIVLEFVAFWSFMPVWPRASLQGKLFIAGFTGLPPVLIIAWAIFLFAKDIPRITLHADEIAFHSLFFVHRRRWSDMSRFVSRFVYIGLSDASQPKGFWDKLNRWGSRGRLFMINLYEVGGEDFCRLVHAWRERTLTRAAEPTP